MNPIEGWYVVELFGHSRYVGRVTEIEAFGAKLGRVDALQSDGTEITLHFSAASVFRLTPTTEEAAREMVKPYEVKPLLASTWCARCEEYNALEGSELCSRCEEQEDASEAAT